MKESIKEMIEELNQNNDSLSNNAAVQLEYYVETRNALELRVRILGALLEDNRYTDAKEEWLKIQKLIDVEFANNA